MDETDRLVESIYAAAIDPDLWPGVLAEVRSRLDLAAVDLVFVDPSGERAPRILENGHDPVVVALWSLSAHKDPDLLAGLARPGELVWSERPTPARTRSRDGSAEETRSARGHWHLVSLVSAGHDALLGVGAHRPGHRPFRNEETGRIEPVLRHLHRAMAVHQRLTVAEEEKRSLADLLDRLRAGAVLVDARARVLLANAAARGFASAADGLTIADDLRGATAAVTARVRRAVAEASDGGNGSTLPLPRPSGRAPYRALVVPLVGSREQARLERVRASALVLITDPDPPLVVEPAALRSYLALTPTEARVTADLLAGHSTERIAARLGISIETVRVHVRHTLTKTGATSRAELIARLLATLPQTVLSTRDA